MRRSLIGYRDQSLRIPRPGIGYRDQSHCTSPRKPWPVLGYRDQTIVPVLGYRDQSTVPVLGYRDQSIVPVLGYRYQALYQSQDTETTRILWPESLYQSQDTVIKPLYQSKRLFNFYFVVVVTNAIFAWQKWSRKLSYSNPSVPSPPPPPPSLPLPSYATWFLHSRSQLTVTLCHSVWLKASELRQGVTELR